MKNIKDILAGVLALAALMVSCVAEQDTTQEVDITTVRCTIPRIDVEEDFATGILDTLTATKATFSNGNFLWSAGDKIGIVPNTGAQIYFEVNNGAGTSTASFDGGDWAMKSTGTFYAYYPLYPDIFLSKDHVSVSYTGQTQSGNNNNLHTGDYWTLYTEGTTAVGNALNFSFNHLTSFFKTYVTVPAGTYTKITFSAPTEVFIKDGYFDLSAQTPTIVGTTMTDELCLDLQNVTFADETELTGYLVLAPVDITGVPITVTVYKDGEPAYEYTLTKANPMVAAKTYAFRATALTQLAASATQANALFAAGATSVSITEPLTEDMAIVLPNTSEAVTLILPTTASTSTLSVSYPPAAESYPATLSITGPEGADLDIRTPNSTVTVNGIAYDLVISRTAANTCIIPAGVTVNNLKVVQGGVPVYGTVTPIDLSEQEDDAIISVSGTVSSLLGEDDEEYAPATGVSLNKTSVNLNVGATETLTATVAPVGAYPNVIWSSSDETVATVSSTGVVTGVAAGSATITVTTISGGFTATCNVSVLPSDYSTIPFTITSIGSTAVSIVNSSSSPGISLEYRVGSGSWTSYTINSAIDLSNGDSLQIRSEGNDGGFSTSGSTYIVTVSGEGTVVASGNIMSLLDNSLQKDRVYQYVFCRLFQNCTKLVDASNLKLPVTSLQYGTGCYSYMFSGCTNLTSAPELPATYLYMNCYRSMFEGCSSLTSAPDILATRLDGGCCASMFKGCTSLTVAPTLPSISNLYPGLPNSADSCFESMFEGCTSLITAPSLPATNLDGASSCYKSMFKGCTSLTTAPNLPANNLVDSCYESMFQGCTSLINVPLLSAMTLEERCYNSMFMGCSNLQTAPRICARTLASKCLDYMFYNCSSLNYVKVDFNAPKYLDEEYDENDNPYNVYKNASYMWLYGVSPTGRFDKPYYFWYDSGSSGIPYGWTIEPEYVDLGLSVKWGMMNIGAMSPAEYGDRFAWGETETKSEYTWQNYSFGTSPSGPFSKYSTSSVLDPEDDAAYVNKGVDWRMPTRDEFSELMSSSNCNWEFCQLGGIYGYKITSKKAGYTSKWIFIPAVSSWNDAHTALATWKYGNYWSSSGGSSTASYMHFDGDDGSSGIGPAQRYLGYPVRPVRE